MGKIKNVIDKILVLRTKMRQYPAYCVFERALRIGVYGGVATIISQLTLGTAWSIPILKITLCSGFLAGLDKFVNELKTSKEFKGLFCARSTKKTQKRAKRAKK